MAGRKLLITGVAIAVAVAGFAQTAHGHGGHGGGGMRGGGRGFGAGAFYGGWGWGWGFGFPFFYPPVFVMGPGMFVPPMPMAMPSGPLMPPPPRGMFQPPADVNAQRNRPNNADPTRAAQLLVVGDRLLKSGNLRKAEERYTQAMRLAPDLAAPRVRLAQVAIARANYKEAASRLREAETAEPGWIITAPDIQGIYGEPTEFTRQISRLESHVQSHPEDRDAWLVLGAEWFLSGRTARAADVFKRLDDPARKSDIALSAFLDASNQKKRERERDR